MSAKCCFNCRHINSPRCSKCKNYSQFAPILGAAESKPITGTVFGSRTTGIETYRIIIDAHTSEQFKPGDRVEIRRVEK